MIRTFIYSISLASTLIGSISASTIYANGGIGSGGGDLKSAEAGSAWFTGNRAVSVCKNIGQDFGYTASKLDELIMQSIKKWEDYSFTKQIHVKRPQEYRPSFTYVPVHSTEGVSNPQCDLTFYFGKETPEVSEAMKQYMNPLSFAERTAYDMKTGWGRGFIWFRNPATTDMNKFPNLKNQSVLEVMLTHEIGHVLGNSHRDGTIMSESIVNLLRRAGDAVSALDFDKIDQQREMVACTSCNLAYKLHPWGDNSEITKKLLGRNPVGTLKYWALVGSLGSLTVILRDDAGEVKFPVFAPEAFGSVFADNANSFKVIRIEERLAQPVLYFESSNGSLQYGFIKSGESKFGLLIERNSHAGPLSLSIIHEHRTTRFASGELCDDSFRNTNQRCNL